MTERRNGHKKNGSNSITQSGAKTKKTPSVKRTRKDRSKSRPATTISNRKRRKMSARRKKSIPSHLRGIDESGKGTISYVLDTNVIMTSWDSLFKFEEHDVHIVSQVLKELDKHKKGHSAEAMNSRKATRILDGLSKGKLIPEIKKGINLTPPKELETGTGVIGKLFFDFSQPCIPESVNIDLSLDEPDDRIIMACLSLKESGKKVVFISNDGNARIKARAAGIDAEEYLNEATSEVVGDEDIKTGFHELSDTFWDEVEERLDSKKVGEIVRYTMTHPYFRTVNCNEFLIFSSGLKLQVVKKETQQRIVAETFTNYHNNQVWGVTPKNIEQELGFHLLMDERIPCVSLAGLAGSGKTYLALAAGLQQAFENSIYNQIIITRATIGSDEDIGFLPGDEEEKMSPWMGSMHDNIEMLTEENGGDGSVSKSQNRLMTGDFLKNRIKVKSLNFMKGRTFYKTFLIIDEAQDLTAKKLKMITTRIGKDSKIVLLGNVAQIDDPYLNEHTSGISVLIRAFADSKLSGHVTLQKGERSPFATEAEERL